MVVFEIRDTRYAINAESARILAANLADALADGHKEANLTGCAELFPAIEDRLQSVSTGPISVSTDGCESLVFELSPITSPNEPESLALMALYRAAREVARGR